MDPNANLYENTIEFFFNSTLILRLKIFMDDKSWNSRSIKIPKYKNDTNNTCNFETRITF